MSFLLLFGRHSDRADHSEWIPTVGGSLRACLFLFLFITRTGQAIPSGDYSSGGTLSAPTGCSPRDHRRLRAVGGGMRELKLFLAGTDRTCSSLTRRSSNTGDGFASSKMFLSEFSSSGGTLTAPTGCSPRASVGLDEPGRGFKSPSKPPHSRHSKYLLV